MNARNSLSEKLAALGSGMVDSAALDFLRIMLYGFNSLQQVQRDTGTAHLCESFDLSHSQNWHDPGDDGYSDANLTSPLDKAKVVVIIEEKLGDQEIDPGINFTFQVAQVKLEGRTLGMFLWVSSSSNAKVVALVDKLHQFIRMAEAVRVRSESSFTPGWITAKCQNVLRPLGYQLIDHLLDFSPRSSDAG